MTGFTETFGGLLVNPTSVAFASYNVAANLVLQWPLEADAGANVVAAQNNVNATVSNLTVAMPDATLATQGAGALFTNTGANTFTVVDTNGATLGAVASGTSWYFYLIDNTTAGGTWQVLQFGAGTSVANAASLAGAGLQAVLTRLNQSLQTTPLNGDYSPGANDLATVLRNTGGTVTYTPITAVTLGAGWFVYVINNGGGTITWMPTGGQTVDGEATKALNPTESAIFFCDGANFWTLGYGRSIVSTVTSSTINVAGGPSTITLNSNQVASQVQNYTGALTGDITVNYGAGPGYWFVENNTSGAYSLILRVNGSDAGVTVPQGTLAVIRSDGSNIQIALTTTAGTVSLINTAAGRLVGGPITSTGTLDLANTAVTPATYGDAADVAQVIVDQYGRITGASNVAISITIAQVQTMTSAALRAQISDPTGTGAAVFANGPALTGTPTAPTNGTATDASTQIATDAFVQAAIAIIAPPGKLAPFAIAAAPAGWLNCDGAAVSRATYANLFAAIGTTFGSGDGSTTFNVPDLRGRVIAAPDGAAGRLGSGTTGGFTGAATLAASGGEQSHTLTVPEMPAHTHPSQVNSGATSDSVGGPVRGTTDGNTGSTGGGGAHNNVQPTLILNYFIKT